MTRAVIRQLRRRSLALAWSAKRPKTATLVLSSKTWWPQSAPRCQRTSLLVFSRALKKRSTKQINKKGLPLDSISNKVCKNHPQLNKTWALLRKRLKKSECSSLESPELKASPRRGHMSSKSKILQSIWGVLWEKMRTQPRVTNLKRPPSQRTQKSKSLRNTSEKSQITRLSHVEPLKIVLSSTR